MSDSQHIERTLEAIAPALLGYFLRRIDTPADAADLVGDTFVIAWRRGRHVPSDNEQARMWIFGIARNVLRHHERGQHRRTAATIELGHAIAMQPRRIDDEDAVAVRAAVDALPARLGELVRLVHWDGFSVEQAAKLLGVLPSTARSRHARAKTLLRAALENSPERQQAATELVEEGL